MNLGTKPKDLRNLESLYYNKFIKEGQRIVIPYSNDFELKLRVIKPEHLLAAKISHLRPKDFMDIANLVNLMRLDGESIDLKEIEKILGVEYQDKFTRFLIINQLEGEFSPEPKQAPFDEQYQRTIEEKERKPSEI